MFSFKITLTTKYKEGICLLVDVYKYLFINDEGVFHLNNLSINNFGISGLRKYGVNEMNLLLLISFRCRSTRKPIATLTFNELEQHVKIKNFSQFTSSYFEKLIQMTWTKEKDLSIYCYLLFNKFEINLEQETVAFYINTEIEAEIIEISDSFSLYDLEFFLNIKSSYAKVAYILTKKMDRLDNYTISMQDFKMLLNIPSKYRMSDIDKKVFSPILENLSIYYPEFQIEKISGKKKNSVGLLKFNFIEEAA